MKKLAVLGVCLTVACALPLGGSVQKKDNKAKPVFTLAWSEYPSWSVFGVASDLGLINGKKGGLGSIEKKWGVDIELKLLEYDPCISLYQTKGCDAVCIANLDVLNPANLRRSVAILPTSTSTGADACLVVGIDVPDKKDKNYKKKMQAALEKLRKRKVYGLKESIAEYVFFRNLELLGEKESDHHFTNRDPGAAAEAMQAGECDAIMVWSPFVLQTLKKNKKARVLFDSSAIPDEVVDLVVVGADALKKPGGKEFACAVIDTFYQFNKQLGDPKKKDRLLAALGEKFAGLDLASMKTAVKQARFYPTPEEGLKLFTGDKFAKTMKGMVGSCERHKFLKKVPSIGFGDATKARDAQLRFDPSFMRRVKGKKE
jgi:NitT/TauT family transport system substrate-binding protein